MEQRRDKSKHIRGVLIIVTSLLLPQPPDGYYNMVIEPQVSKYCGQLRSIPLLKRLGYETYTFAAEWKRFISPIVNFNYVLAQKELSIDQLVCITNQAIERNVFSIRDILHQINSRRIKNCVFIVDTDDFVIRDWCRPLIDMRHIQRKYSDLLKAYVSHAFGSNSQFILKDTENLFFQEMAFIYFIVLGNKVKRTEDLFVFDEHTCFLPVWDILLKFARIDITFEQIKHGLSFWVEKDKTLINICNRLWNTLAEFNREKSEVEKARNKFLEKMKTNIDKVRKLIQVSRLEKWDEWRVLKL